MGMKRVKREMFYIKKAWREYHEGGRYLKERFVRSRSIFQHADALEKGNSSFLSPSLSIHVLTGKADACMMAWALASFFLNTIIRGKLYIHSDGTLTEKQRKDLRRLFPSAVLYDSRKFFFEYGDALAAYPAVREKRAREDLFFLFRKLTDPLLVSSADIRLIIDSDVVWFRNSEEICNSLADGVPRPLMMETENTCPIFFRDGSQLAEKKARYNSGIVLYRREHLSLSQIEEYCNLFDTEQKSHMHFIEQGGYAWCLPDVQTLPRDRYAIKGRKGPHTVVRHYTSPRRPLFYLEALPLLYEDLFY